MEVLEIRPPLLRREEVADVHEPTCGRSCDEQLHQILLNLAL